MVDLPWAAPPPVADDEGQQLLDVTLPGVGASSLGGGLVAGTFARVVMSLFALERSGRLVVEAGDLKGTLFVLNGEPVHAQVVNGDARLLARLQQLGAAADAVVDPALPLIPLLVRKQWAEPLVILHALRDEVRAFLAAALSAEIGVYRFFDDVEFADHVPLVSVNPFAMLLEQRRSTRAPDAQMREGELLARKYPRPLPGFANAADRLRAFTGGFDLASVVDGMLPAHEIYVRARIDALAGGLVLGTLDDSGLIELTDAPAPAPIHDTTPSASSGVVPVVMPTDGITLVGSPLPGGGDLLSLYLLLKPERDMDALLGIAKDATLLEVERGFRARMKDLDPRSIAVGAARPHMLARVEELRVKVERAYHARLAETPGERTTHIQIERKLGEGGMAEVFAGREGDRMVALKRIHPTRRNDDKLGRLFLREARLVRRIQHPNVVRIFTVGKSGDDLYLTMELVDGADLALLLRKANAAKRRVPFEVAARIMADACGGIHAAHSAHDASGSVVPILHRDISPQNILVGLNGDVKVTDFGVAKAIGSTTESMDRPGLLKGKIPYLAPELIDGFPASAQTDVYAAAMTLYACFAPLPFHRKGLLETMRAIIAEDLPPLTKADADFPPRLDEIIARGGAKDPADRYRSAQTFQLDLEDFLAKSPPAAVGQWVASLSGVELPVPDAAPSNSRDPTEQVSIVEESVDVADL